MSILKLEIVEIHFEMIGAWPIESSAFEFSWNVFEWLLV